MSDSSEPSEEAAEAAPEGAAQDPAADPALAQPPSTSQEPDATQNRRVVVAGTLAAIGALAVPFLLMASDRRWTFSMPLGGAGLLVGTIAILYALGTFRSRGGVVVVRTEGATLGSRVSEVALSGATLAVFLALCVKGVVWRQIPVAAVVVPGLFLWLVIAIYRLGRVLGAWSAESDGRDRSLIERHGFWLIAITTVLYLPMLGSYSLSDPWETHYGEVAREMLSRDDWITTWWAQDGWFFSKPILDFWLQGIFFSLLGVRYMPDEMLRAVGRGHWPQPEWACRMPVFLLTIVCLYVFYKAAAVIVGRRAGLLGALVLVTTPYCYFIAHQTMTDMLYVAPLFASMGLLALGFHTDPAKEAGLCELRLGKRAFHVSAWHVLFGAVLLVVLPQVLYLATRNLTFQVSHAPYGFAPHLDQFWSGSGPTPSTNLAGFTGNCGLPGNEICRKTLPRYSTAFQMGRWALRLYEPAVMAALWSMAGGALLWMNRGERRLQRLFFLGAWFFMCISALGKGAPALVIPIAVAGAFVLATKRYQDLARLEFVGMLLLVSAVTLPWFVQMYLRHGGAFTDRLIFHDMFKRAFVHVHDTNAGEDVTFRYYVWQLGYGLFPWTGLAAGGLLWWLRRPDRSPDGKSEFGVLLAVWVFAAFGMFTITLTKFHHYIFPMVPPTAMLTGLLLDRALGDAPLPRGRALGSYLGGLVLAAVLLVYGVSRFFPGQVNGEVVEGVARAPSYWIGALALVAGTVAAALAVRLGRVGTEPAADDPVTPDRRYESLALGVIGIASAVAVGLAGRDLFAGGDIEGQERLMWLFTYNYGRSWPKSLDFDGVLIAFTIVAGVLCLGFVFDRLRRGSTVLLMGVALVWCGWGVNAYLVKAAPHWGQRETILAYYQHRASPDEPIVGYQMNWKGENFYTGNKIPAFVSSGKNFTDWVTEQRDKGVRVMYFTTEHGRVNSLKRELPEPKGKFEKITDEKLNNKFFLGRAEL